MAAARVTGVQNIRFCATSTVIHRQPLNVQAAWRAQPWLGMAVVGNSITATQVQLRPVWIVSTGASWCGAFPPVDGFCAGGHAVEDASDELGMAAPAAGEAELVEFSGGAVVVVNRLIHGAGVDLAVPVEVDRRRAASQGHFFALARCWTPWTN